MTDDDKPRRPRSHWGDTERVGVGLAGRRPKTHPHGVPVPDSSTVSGEILIPDGSPLTQPFDVIDQEPSEELEETGKRLRRPSSMPANVGHVINAVQHTNKRFAELKQNQQRIANAILDLNTTGPSEAVDVLKGKVEDLSKKVALLLKLLIAVATAAGGSLFAVGKGLYQRGAHEGADGVRLDHVERSVDDLRQDIREERRPRFESPDRWHAPPLATPPTSSTTVTPKDKP
jgi:hypothetical protein